MQKNPLQSFNRNFSHQSHATLSALSVASFLRSYVTHDTPRNPMIDNSKLRPENIPKYDKNNKRQPEDTLYFKVDILTTIQLRTYYT